MKNIRIFDTRAEFEAFMAGSEEETIFPNIALIEETSELKFYSLLPNIDTEGYATTFENGKTYLKEARLFKYIVDDFLDGYDPEMTDPAIWLDLASATIDIFLYQDRQTFSIENEPLYVNYLSKITNFCDEDGVPTSTLNLFPDYVNREEYTIGGGSSSNVSSTLHFDTGLFEETQG